MARRRGDVLTALDLDVWVRRDHGRDRVRDAAVESVPAVDVAATLDWERLEAAVAACVKCALHTGRTRTVFGVGNRRAHLMVVGEAPGAEEDRQGLPFVGRAGQLLTAMLRAIGFARDDVFIANVLKCRPPNNRDPRPDEVGCCLPYLERQIALVDPRVILCVGRVAAQNLLGTDAPLGRLRGQVHAFGAAGRPVIVTYHPAYLLRTPADKAKAWQDLLRVKDLLGDREAGVEPAS
jgi:uracil-DNA glycosylase family 4